MLFLLLKIFKRQVDQVCLESFLAAAKRLEVKHCFISFDTCYDNLAGGGAWFSRIHGCCDRFRGEKESGWRSNYII